MDEPKPWSQDWNEALQAAQNTATYVRSGLNSLEFAALARVSVDIPGRYARRGIDAFKAKFGEGCSCELVNRPNPPQKEWRFTFSGPLREHPDDAPIPGLIRGPEFCQVCNVRYISSLSRFTRNGHAWFRERFPGWDYLEVPRHGTKSTIRWYGKLEILGEQPEDALPSDHLTAHQFSLLKGINLGNLKNICRQQGLEKFQLKFPGWSFHENLNALIYFCCGPEVEILNLAQFAQRMNTTPNSVVKWVKQGSFADKFTDWEVKTLSAKGSKIKSWFFSPKVTSQVELINTQNLDQSTNNYLVAPPVELLEDAADSPIELVEDVVDSKGWPSEWQAALTLAQVNLPEFHTTLTAAEFADLVGSNPKKVNAAARKGLQYFKEIFGENCSFQNFPHVRRLSHRRLFVFYGIVHPLARKDIGSSLLSESDFSQYVKATLHEVRNYSQQGHQAFRKKWPEWEFIEHQSASGLERWYGSIKSLGEQSESSKATESKG